MGHIHKTESLYLLGAVFKISNDHPHSLYMGVLPGNKRNNSTRDFIIQVL